MRTVLSLVLLHSAILVAGQTCDTLNGRAINCIDSAGREQGYWQERRKVLLYSQYSGYGTKEGCQYSEDAYYQIMSEGQYADDRRTGTWTYYDRSGFDINRLAHDKGHHFGQLKPARQEPAQYVLHYDLRGLETSGQVFLLGDTVPVRFHGEEFEFLSQDGRSVGPFPKSSFDFELERLFAGVYNRDLTITSRKSLRN